MRLDSKLAGTITNTNEPHSYSLLRAAWLSNQWIRSSSPLPLADFTLSVSRFSSGFRTDWEASSLHDGFSTDVLSLVFGKISNQHGSGTIPSVPTQSQTWDWQSIPGIRQLDLTVDYLWDLPLLPHAKGSDSETFLHLAALEYLTLRTTHHTYLDGPTAPTPHLVSPFSPRVSPRLRGVNLDVPWTALVSPTHEDYELHLALSIQTPIVPLPLSFVPWHQLETLTIVQPIPVQLWRMVAVGCGRLREAHVKVFQSELPHGGTPFSFQFPAARGVTPLLFLERLSIVFDGNKDNTNFDHSGVNTDAVGTSPFNLALAGLVFHSLSSLCISSSSPNSSITIPFLPSSAIVAPLPELYETYATLSRTLIQLSLHNIHATPGLTHLLQHTPFLTHLHVETGGSEQEFGFGPGTDSGELWESMLDTGSYTSSYYLSFPRRLQDAQDAGSKSESELVLIDKLLPMLQNLSVVLHDPNEPSRVSNLSLGLELGLLSDMVSSRWRSRSSFSWPMTMFHTHDMARKAAAQTLRTVTIRLESHKSKSSLMPLSGNWVSGAVRYSWAASGAAFLQAMLGKCAVEGLELNIVVV
ncbi:hypothetical protein FA15DRAFT_703140 [Coprinopsis marcescibilis]|nr:hypothetical protein FA15DRAFT_703140 [Coprinopsis marcescibilis]